MEITTGLIVDLGDGKQGYVAGVVIQPIGADGSVIVGDRPATLPIVLLPEFIVPATEDEPTPILRRFRDIDGDVWKELAPSSGLFVCYRRDTDNRYSGLGEKTESQLYSRFGVTELEPVPAK